VTVGEAHRNLPEPADAAGFLIGESPNDPDEIGAISGRSRAWIALRRDPLFWLGLVLATLVIGASVLAPWLAPYGPEESFRDLMPPDGTALPPSARFPLGTDVSGRDYLSRLLYAGQATLLVGLGANLVATTLGVLVGLVAGYAGTVRVGLPFDRKIAIPVDSLLMRVTDIGLAFPVLLLAIAMAYVLGQSLALVTIIIAAVLWTTTARLVYGRVLLVRSAEFVTAAQALGCTAPRIVSRHILPHIVPLIMVTASLGIATTILFEATLSFLGAGAPVQTPTWGRLLADHVGWYRNDFRLPLLPGVAILTTVLAFNLLGDALRDALDPHGWRR
jgi:peptide/nickel transport system permease protein